MFRQRLVLHFIIVAALVLGFLGEFAGTPVQAAPAKAGPATWTVLVGAQSQIEKTDMGEAGAWQFMRFYPDSITVDVGDTIIWKLNSAEPHTVTFPKPGDKPYDLVVPEGGTSQRLLFNPLVAMPQGGASYDGTAITGSGQMGGAPSSPTEYKLTVTKEGTFSYFCGFHTMMLGKVIVQPAGTAYPKSQAEIDAAAKALIAQDAAAAAKALPAAQKVTNRAGSNGGTIYGVNMGYGDGMMSFMRFSPTELTLRVGDSIEFTQADVDAPHTVSFLSGEPDLSFVLPEPQPNGPPKLVFNPAVLAPAGGATYSGKGFFNSGLINGTKNPAPGPRSYTISFDTPGRYEFICILHDEMGMSGYVNVVAKDAPIPAPAPATLPLSGSGPDFGGSLLLTVALGMFLMGAGFLIRGWRYLSR